MTSVGDDSTAKANRSRAADGVSAADAPEPIRLASVVAVDIAGYSRLAERDRAAAARQVLEMRASVESVATRNLGRIFNTAGDGLMLEFGSAERALTAIAELVDGASAETAPVRIGAHLGDVFVTRDGDLLGHGVNVAARLQSMADPGRALVSGDLRSAVQGDKARRLVARGRLPLAKMQGSVQAFEVMPSTLTGRQRIARLALGPYRIRRRIAVGAFVVVLVAVGVAAWKAGWLSDRGRSPPSTPLVAVLPFDNLSSEPNSAYFADGMSEEILDALARSEVVRVTARGSSFQFRGARKAEAGRILGTDYVLDGSIRRDGALVRITAQLSDVHNGQVAWSHIYDSDMSKALEVENDIAGEIARALKLVLVAAGDEPDARTIDPLAYELFLRGREALLRGSDLDAIQAMGFFREAVDRAPTFSRGWTALAAAQLALSKPRVDGKPQATEADVVASTNRALELDPRNGDAYIILARMAVDWSERERLLERALAVAPDDPVVISRQGQFLADVGLERESLPDLRRAYQLSPLNLGIVVPFVDALAHSGNGEEARHVLDDTMARMPMYFGLWRKKLYFLLFDGRYVDVEKMLAPDTVRPDDYTPDYLQNDELFLEAYRSRNPADIDAALEPIRKLAEKSIHDVPNLVWKLALLGRTDEAFAFAEEKTPYEEGLKPHTDLPPTYYDLSLFLYPAASKFRHDPRFLRLWAYQGVLQYWLQSGKWPDFCSEPDLGYDCKAEAEKLLREANR